MKSFVNPSTASVKEQIKNQQVHFEYFRDGEFWYKTDLGLLFPVPLSDVNTAESRAQLLRDDRAVYFMRWIKLYIEACKTSESV